MTTILTFFIMYKTIKNLGVNNPVNLSMNLMILSTYLLFLMHLMKSESWFPILFYLMFLGGILIMFLILSSIMPNEKSTKKKWKFSKTMVILSFICCTLTKMNILTKTNMSNLFELKMFNTNLNTMTFFALTMMLYFLIYSMMIISMKMPLHSNLCQLKINFVN